MLPTINITIITKASSPKLLEKINYKLRD